jgi:hypothetical protein
MSKDPMQMKKEDEQAGRLDYVYQTNLTIAECVNRIRRKNKFFFRRYFTAKYYQI